MGGRHDESCLPPKEECTLLITKKHMENIHYSTYSKLVTFSLILLASSCSNSDKKIDECVTQEKNFNELVELQAQDSLTIDETFMLTDWKVGNDLLVLYDWGTKDSLLNVFSLPNGEPILRKVKVGNGPGELIAPMPGHAVSDNKFLIYDMMRRLLMLYDTNSNDSEPLTELPLPVDEEGMAPPFTFISQLNDSLFLMKTDSRESSEWQCYDLKNDKLLWSEINPYRGDALAYIPCDFNQLASDSTLLIAYKYMDLVEIYNLDPSNGIRKKTSFGSLEKRPEDIHDSKDLKKTSLSVTNNSNLFFSLLSSDGNNSGDIIETFDIKSGLPVKRYRLDKEIMSINLSPDGRLMGYSQDEDSSKFYIWNLY